MLRVVESSKTYSSDEVVKKLGISQPMIRKLNFFLSKEGISFRKERGRLAYTTGDLALFKRLLELYEQTGVKFLDAVEKVSEEYHASRVKNEDKAVADAVVEPITESVTTPVTTVTEREQTEVAMAASLAEMEKTFTNELKKMDEKLDHMKTYIDGRLEKRDDQLLQVIREIQQIKKVEQERGFINWLKRLFKKSK